MRSTRWLSVIVLVGAAVLRGAPASAAFHLMAVDQVFFGTEDCPNAHYVMLRMLAGGQTFVSGQRITNQNPDGSAATDFGAFASNVSNGANSASIIIGTAEAAALFDIELDQEVEGALLFPDGRVCFSGSGDCVAYGAYTGNNTGGGDPAPAPVRGMALIREGNSGQDSDDFALGAPAPRNNAGMSGTLGTCPGGADTPTPTVAGGDTPTPTRIPTGVPGCVGDCDDTLSVSIGELIRCVSISLGAQPLSSCEACDCLGNGTVPINCLVQGVNSALNGCP